MHYFTVNYTNSDLKSRFLFCQNYLIPWFIFNDRNSSRLQGMFYGFSSTDDIRFKIDKFLVLDTENILTLELPNQ